MSMSKKKLFQRTEKHLVGAIDAAIRDFEVRSDLPWRASCQVVSHILLATVANLTAVMAGKKGKQAQELYERLVKTIEEWHDPSGSSRSGDQSERAADRSESAS